MTVAARRIDEQLRAGFGTGKVTLPLLGITTIPSRLLNTLQLQLMSLREMFLADNSITQLPVRALAAWNNLRVLNLHGNKLSSLPPEINLLRFVRVLDFSSNRLKTVPLELMQLDTLEELHLNFNTLRFFPQPLKLPNIKELNVSHNFLEFLPDGLQHCTALTKLDLSHNVMASAAILPSRRVAADDDMDDPMLRPWEWEAQFDPGSREVVWFHKQHKIASRIDPRLAALTLRKQHERVMAHLALTRNDGIVVGVENAVADSDEEEVAKAVDPLHGLPMVKTVVKYPTPRDVHSPIPTTPVASQPRISSSDSSDIDWSTPATPTHVPAPTTAAAAAATGDIVVDRDPHDDADAISVVTVSATHKDGADRDGDGNESGHDERGLSDTQKQRLRLDLSNLRNRRQPLAGRKTSSANTSTTATATATAAVARSNSVTHPVSATAAPPTTGGPQSPIPSGLTKGQKPHVVTKTGKVYEVTAGGKVVWKWDAPVEVSPDYATPRVATVRFQGQVLRALLREGRGEWQVLQEPDTGKLQFRNNITLERLDRPPEGVDLFGGMKSLQYLDLSHNKLVQIPESVATLQDLRELLLDHNKLPPEGLPSALGRLTRLTKLSCRYNVMSTFPLGVCQATSLRTLLLCGNGFSELPPQLGKLVNLRVLWVSENKLKGLPKELSTCTQMKELRVGINPMHDRWKALLASGTKKLMWTCRQLALEAERGAPPVMEYDRMGIGEECLVPAAEAKQWHTAAIQRAQQSKTLSFGWKDLKAIPDEAFSIAGLRELKIVGNDIKYISEDIRRLTALRLLHMHKNKTKAVAAMAFEGLHHLRVVNFADNKLKVVPRSLPHVTSLVDLFLDYNRLDHLPANFGHMLPKLEKLHVNHNQLQDLPPSLGMVTNLRELWVSHNHLSRLPDSIDHLTKLVSLRANRNAIEKLPRALVNMRLIELQLGNNLITDIPSYFACSRLRTTLQRLILASNQLVDVTPDLRHMAALKVLKIESNPLKSPPHECTASVTAIRDYCALRYRRIREFVAAAGYHQFVLDPRRLAPTAHHCIIGGAGHCTEQDLDDFDIQADKYVNGRVYEVDVTAEHIMREFVLRRHERATAVRAIMIRKLVKMLDACRINNWVDDRNFCSNVSRPWGPQHKFVRCYAITASALFGPNNGRGSVLQRALARKEVYFRGIPEGPDISFLATLDTLRNYRGPYGFVGTPMDSVDFADPALKEFVDPSVKAAARDDITLSLSALANVAATPKHRGEKGVSEHKGRDGGESGSDSDSDESDRGDEGKRRQAGGGRGGHGGHGGNGGNGGEAQKDAADEIFREYDTKTALVVQRWLWSEQDRRNYEREQEAISRLMAIVEEEGERLRDSADGKRTIKIEIRRWNARLQKKRTKYTLQLKNATRDLREFNQTAAELISNRHAFLRGNEDLFDDEDDMEGQVVPALEDVFGAHDEYEEAVRELATLDSELADLGFGHKKQRVARAIRNFVERTQSEALAKFIDKQRLRAHLEGSDRPWDGIDGADFAQWKKELEVVTLDNGREQIITPYMRALEAAGDGDDDELPLTRMEQRVVAMKRGCGVVWDRLKEALGW